MTCARRRRLRYSRVKAICSSLRHLRCSSVIAIRARLHLVRRASVRVIRTGFRHINCRYDSFRSSAPHFCCGTEQFRRVWKTPRRFRPRPRTRLTAIAGSLVARKIIARLLPSIASDPPLQSRNSLDTSRLFPHFRLATCSCISSTRRTRPQPWLDPFAGLDRTFAGDSQTLRLTCRCMKSYPPQLIST